jgi:serine/threonine protein kinase
VWLADFGLSFDSTAERNTIDGEVVGPRFFTAPELDEGGAIDVTPAADVYSLGQLIFYMLTGGKRIARENVLDSRYAARTMPPSGSAWPASNRAESGLKCPELMLWTAPPPALECAIDVSAVRAPVIRRSQMCKRSRQSASISRSQFFRFTASMQMAMWLFAVSSSDDMFWHSFRSCHHAWLASRPVHRRIIGRVNFKRSGTRYA